MLQVRLFTILGIARAPMSLKLQLPPAILMLVGAACTILLGFYLLVIGQTTVLTAAIALGVLLIVFRWSRTSGIYLAIAFLIFLGDLRRISTLLNGFSSNDLLVLVGPAFVVLITLPLFVRLRLKDMPSKLMFALIVMIILGIFNPAQGGLVVGFAGALITLPPLLWFWVGRTFGTEAVIRTVAYRILIPAALIGCLLGLYQTFAGPTFWQNAWVKHQISTHFDVLKIGHGGIRAFGFSTATSEYINLILMASLFCILGAIAGRRALLFPLIIFLPTLFLASSRGAIFRLLIGSAIGYTFKSRDTKTLPLRMAFALLIGFGGVTLALSQYGDVVQGSHASTAHAELAHQVNGLAHPLDAKYSTATQHVTEIQVALLTALRHPIGFGTGAASIASAKYSAVNTQISSEFDISDTFLTLGIPGGLTFSLLITILVIMGYRYTKIGPKDISLTVFAMMFSFIGSWFFQGEYGNGPLFFIMLGCMVRIVHQVQSVHAPRSLGRRPANLTRPHFSETGIALANVCPSMLD